MTADLFRRVAVHLFGDDHAWPLSQLLGIGNRNVRYFRNGDKPIPPGIAQELATEVRARIAQSEELLKELDACG